MFIFLSDEFLMEGQLSAGSSLPIRNLIAAARAGYHHLVISRDLVDKIVQVCDLTRSDQEILKTQIRPRYATGKGELRTVVKYAEIVPDNFRGPIPANAVRLELRHFSEPQSSGPARLIIENAERDSRGLEMLLHFYRRYLMHSARVKYELVNGGGSTTAATFEQAAMEPRPAICIVDSDRRAPGAPVGETAGAVLRVAADLPFGTSGVAVLPVRELENALPLRSIRLVYEHLGDRDTARKCQQLIDFCEEEGGASNDRSRYVAFLDFKSGLSETDFEIAATYAKQIIDDLWKFVNREPAVPDWGGDEFIAGNPFRGISNHLLSVVTECFDHSYHIVKDIARNIVKHPYHNELAEMFEVIVAYCAAPQPLPVRNG